MIKNNISISEDDDEGVEKELGNENVSNVIPFDPNEININIVPRTIGQLVEMMEYNEILVPKFQRLPNLWNTKKKSRFIESLMLSLPIPLFYFDEGADKKWRVIDGLQRISTLEQFILGNKKKGKNISGVKQPFQLADLEFRTEYNNLTWAKLPRDIQRRIQTNQVTINLIGKGTPEQVKYNIYSRINQGGIELKPQEIRTALFQGYKMEFIEKLIKENTRQGKLFLKATDNSIPSRRQQDLDFITRFISFYLLDYTTYEPDMDSFLTKGMNAIPKDKKKQEAVINAFTRSMQVAYEVFGKKAFRKIKGNEERRQPINKPLFEIVSVYFAKISTDNILKKKEKFIKAFYSLQREPKFLAAITSGTATKESVKQRHEDFLTLINRFES